MLLALRRRLSGALLALVLVLAFVGLLITARGHQADPDASFVRAAPAPSPTTGTAATPRPSATPSASSSPRTTERAQSPSAKLSASPRRTPPARAPLTVLNNSRVSGLGARAAAHFRAVGWQVVLVGNFTGRVPRTTIFYGAGEYAAAVQLARDSAGAQAIEPRFAGLPGSGLTIVLTSDFQP